MLLRFLVDRLTMVKNVVVLQRNRFDAVVHQHTDMVGRCGKQELVIALFRRHIGAVRQRALEVDDGEVIGEENVADVRKGEVVVVIVLLQLIHPDAGGLSAVSADGEVPRCGQRDENRAVLLVDGDGLVILVEQDVVCIARMTVCVFDHIGVSVGENVIEVEVVLSGNESGEQQEHQQQGCYSAHFGTSMVK